MYRPSIKTAKLENCPETIFLEPVTLYEILNIIGNLKKSASVGVVDVTLLIVKEDTNYLCLRACKTKL